VGGGRDAEAGASVAGAARGPLPGRVGAGDAARSAGSAGRAREVRAAPWLVHAPNHVGDVVMALPAIARLAEAAAREGAEVDVAVRAHVEPLLRMAALPVRLVPYEVRGGAWARAAWRLRRRGYGRAVLLAPSFRAALFARLAGARRRRGTPTDGRAWLLTERAPRVEAPGEHRVRFYLRVAGVAGDGDGEVPVPRLRVPAEARAELDALGARGDGAPVVGIFPGSRAPARRWPADRYAELARRLAARGLRVWVFGDARERELTARVAAAAGARGLDWGGRTSLPVLAAALARCRWLVTNDTGPLHLAAALGTPVIAVFGSSDPRRTGPVGVPHRVLWRRDLPCVPCLRNACPRRGRGTALPSAVNECLALVSVDEVERAVEEMERTVTTP
jgi:heptosyltransferase-2